MDENSNKNDRIVVGVDGSAHSVAALRYAARLGEALDVPVEAVTTWFKSAGIPPWSDSSLEATAQDVLDGAFQSAFGGNTPQRVVGRARLGAPASTLIAMSKSSGMLVLGSRGRGGFAGMLLGSVSAACTQHAHCPVLIVRGDTDNAMTQVETEG